MTSGAFLGFELLRPGMGLLFVGAPVALLLGMFALHVRARARRTMVSPRHQPRFLAGFSVNRARLRVACATAATFFMAFSLLGPVRGYSLREVVRHGLDLVVCVDTSRSMLVQDLKPDRLTRARREVSALLEMLQGDRVALVAFSGDVRNIAPLTRDRQTLRWFLDGLSPKDNITGGTDLGGALEHALELFDGRTGAHEAIVLLTDGEDLEGRGFEVAQAAAERGIRIYIVGMGTQTGGKVPAEGRGFVRDETGEEVVSSMDDTALRAIADTTGGAYLSATDAALPLEEIYEKRISRLEGRELVEGKERIPHDRYQWMLVLALGCMLAEIGLRERRPGKRSSEGGAA